MNEANEKILGRVRQLLSMAGDTSSPHEAAIAAGRARKLMDAHQIRIEDLKEESGFGFAKVDKPYRCMPLYRSWLAVSVAKYNDCKAILTNVMQGKSYARQMVFQGYESDVQIAAAMYDYLASSIDRLCADHIRPLGYTRYPAVIGDAFKKGAASAINGRLKAMLKEREDTLKMIAVDGLSTGTSLVVSKMKAVEAEFGEAKYQDTKTKPNRDTRALIASHHGREAGKKIAINPFIGGPTNKLEIE
jgi:hypothetical protein